MDVIHQPEWPVCEQKPMPGSADELPLLEKNQLGRSETVDQGRVERELVFFVSPRIIDFDAFLPTALELKAQRPGWRLRFVTFSRENFDFIARNDTHLEGLRRCASLHYLGWETGNNWLHRSLLRAKAFARVAGWLLARPRPVIILGLPFTTEPYATWRLIGRLRGGRAVTLWKYRSPDLALDRMRQVRKYPPKSPPRAFIANRFARDTDLFVHYHDDEARNIEWARPYGRLDNVPELLIGMPHWLPAWSRMIDDEVQAARSAFIADGLPADAEYYAMFPAKVWSAETLHHDDSIVWTFKKAFWRIIQTRPKAVILLRPHPKALETPYFEELLEAVGPGRARISWLHPEVLLQISHRAVFNNPTNILFSCFRGRFMDVSDYHPEHFAEHGDRSLAHGFGVAYVNPHRADFEETFDRLLSDDAAHEAAADSDRSEALLARNPASIERLLAWIEADGDATQPTETP